MQGHLISCALDGCIKVWTTADTPAPGAVLDSSPAYTHTQDGLHVSHWPVRAACCLNHHHYRPAWHSSSIACLPLCAVLYSHMTLYAHCGLLAKRSPATP